MTRLGFIACVACLCAGCFAHADSVRALGQALHPSALFITEVAQATAFAGSSADKVEVFCAAADGCDAFRVCDASSAGQAACSALQPALAHGQRTVVSRGSSITTSDEVWLTDTTGAERPETRVGPFGCDNGASRSRPDCASAAFAACAAPNLGQSSGGCSGTSFVSTALFTKNQHGQPEAGCSRAMCRELRAAIDAAQHSIDFAVYGVRGQPEIIAALAAAQARGVRVRGVVDSENKDCSALAYPETHSLIDALAPHSVVCDLGPGYSYIMHDKFFVFDAARVWTGSTNVSDTELGGEYNSDVSVLLESAELAAAYGAEFDEMWSAGLFHHRKSDNTPHLFDGFDDGTVIESYFSPTDHAIQRAVLPLIDHAVHTLDIAMFFFTDASIETALEAAHARGVQVRMVLDASGAANQYSKHPQLCAAGIEVKVENWGGKSHSKWAVADAGTPYAQVLFGSMNWTSAGDSQNDENTLVVRNPTLASTFGEEFEREWADLAGVPLCTLVAAEGAGSSRCGAANDCSQSCSSGACCDGVDNDHDHLIDLQEEACACADGIDNDGDGYTDADDYDCRPAQHDPE